MVKRSLFTSIMLTVLATSTATISVSNQPTFDLEHSTNETTVFEGDAARLICRVKNLGRKTIAWINKDNLDILTVGRYTYTTDDRISLSTNEASTEWILTIRYVKKSDAGWYECQMSTSPVLEHDVYLNVAVTEVSIVGSKELYIRSGDSLNLTCIINRSQDTVLYIFWYQNERMINYDERSKAKIEARSLNDSFTASQLFIPVTSILDSGNYSCKPSNAASQSVQVYVIRSEAPSTENDYTENYDGTDDGIEGYFSYFVDAVCYYTSIFCRE